MGYSKTDYEESRILLYYGFAPLEDPQAVMFWQRTLCEMLELKGRILVSKHGINGTVGGSLAACKEYVRRTKAFPAFKGMEFKWSEGGAEDFPRLSVKVRDEIVAFGAPDELEVDDKGVIGGGVHLKPEQLHELMEERGDEVVFFDGRNAMEAQIGKFKDAVIPDVRTTHDFIKEIESGKYDDLKDKPVVTYCTGGIRCEILSSLMKKRGFKEVYQLDGGIVRYGEKFGDKGFWEGSLYVFDRRMHMEFSDDAKVIGRCVHCDQPTNDFRNCLNLQCRKQTLICDDCFNNGEKHYCEQCAAQPATTA
ncbi:hypothetical protein BSR28_01395 [Boudabousia liubingyangii]|uniref:oxygen-dependent tRNA uridine(34) hydroxylase TrhO n=1 Tax=Boudabousia liubingyangii TaxID=1921764 RepID=UPI00093C9976|nr:rhodanese-related sulfurtransferase [Boudabousia liubingyangii]OKL48385.1 hypothetical protein BSR28_01395 [Boudabousia liubingyangii]